MESERTINNSFGGSVDLIHPVNTPRELLTLVSDIKIIFIRKKKEFEIFLLLFQRSTTRNSQNSVMSNTVLDSSIRTNRTTELRLSKDMV